MARTTVKDLEARIAEQNGQIDKLMQMVETLAAGKTAPKAEQPKPKKERPWLDPCPEYATAAQRVEYDKLAERARKQRDQVAKALGTESIRAFIPVPKTVDRMPHTVKWTASYSK